MTHFTRLAAYKTQTRHRGHVLELTAKLAGNRVVFAGSPSGQEGIDANAGIRTINDCWKVYCAVNNGWSIAGVPQIDQAMIDAARQK
jgi:hypothetical protein